MTQKWTTWTITDPFSHTLSRSFAVITELIEQITMIYSAKLFLLAVATMAMVSAQRCGKSGDCAKNEEYCAGGICTPIGNCTQRLDCFNPDNDPYAVVMCEGLMECTDNQCGMICGEQVCPDGGPRSDCERGSLPCDMEECKEAETCYNDPCGGSCTAVFFNAAGDIVCADDKTSEPPLDGGIEPACNMDMDCDGLFNETDAYCSQGICLPMGSCTEDVDCVNPSNIYPVVACVGVLQCDTENGQCGRECGPSSCPEGVEEVNCVSDPCVDYAFGCSIAASCVANYCGECSTILFNDAGFVLDDCNHNSTGISDANATEFSGESCMSDMDCAEDESEYCANGICLTIGQCKEPIDCFNPANGPYPVPACVGYLDCPENFCTLQCGPECPGGEERVVCPDPTTCNVTSCDEAVSCNIDGCGGECTEIFFNEAGTQVCMSEVTNLPCTSDADCTGDAIGGADADGMYCAQGECMSKGSCNDDIDCFNPSNIYAAVGCVGYTSCQEGRCGITCGPACQDGSDSSVCEPSPCDDNECAAAISCANDQCNGCNAIFFDASGNEVENCDAVTFSSTPSGAAHDSYRFAMVSGVGMSFLIVLLQSLI
jgi:hypothetical protein